jgi:hypothetical protein
MEVGNRIQSYEETASRSDLTFLLIKDHRYEPKMKRWKIHTENLRRRALT